MGMTEWEDAYQLLDTAKKLVCQAEQILVRDGMSDAWTDELVCIVHDIEDYNGTFHKSWLEGYNG